MKFSGRSSGSSHKTLAMRGWCLTVQAVRMFHQGITHATRCTRTWHHHMGVHILRKFVQVQRVPCATKIMKKLQGAMGRHGATTEYSWLSCQVEKSWKIWPLTLESPYLPLLNSKEQHGLYVFLLWLFQDYIVMNAYYLNDRVYHPCLLAAPLALIIPKSIQASCNPWRT